MPGGSRPIKRNILPNQTNYFNKNVAGISKYLNRNFVSPFVNTAKNYQADLMQGKSGLLGPGPNSGLITDKSKRADLLSSLNMLIPGPRSKFVPPNEIGPLYHGTPVSFPPEKFNYQKTNREGLFGKGLYLTDNPRIANSYAENIQRAHDQAVVSGLPKTKWFSNKGEALKHIAEKPDFRRAVGFHQTLGNLSDEEFPFANHAGGYYGVHEYKYPIPKIAPNIQRYSLHPSRLLHMDEEMPPGYVDAAVRYAQSVVAGRAKFKRDEGYGYFNNDDRMQEIEDSIRTGGPYTAGHAPKTPSHLYTRLSQNIGYRRDANAFFRKLGFDALEYDGGRRIGGFGRHRAFVAIKPGVVKPYLHPSMAEHLDRLAELRAAVEDYHRHRTR